MSPLELRKQLLIAESEINRLQMQEEWQAMRDGVRSLAGRAKSFGSIASSAAVMVAGLAAFRRGRSAKAGAKASWFKTILKGAGLVSTFWLAFRTKGHDQEKRQPTGVLGT